MAAITVCDNFLNNVFVAPASGNYMDVTNPATDEVIGRVALSSAAVHGCARGGSGHARQVLTGVGARATAAPARVQDVDSAVAHASSALEGWQQLTVKSRAQVRGLEALRCTQRV